MKSLSHKWLMMSLEDVKPYSVLVLDEPLIIRRNENISAEMIDTQSTKCGPTICTSTSIASSRQQ